MMKFSLPACVLGSIMLAAHSLRSEPPPENPLVAGYNYVVGTQTIGSAYHFTNEPKLIETARAILALGSNTIKFSLAPEKGTAPRQESLAAMARLDPAMKAVFDMPFANYLLWVSPIGAPKSGGPFAPVRLPAEQEEIHDLACHLLKTYNGTGKTFYLGNWEGDWLLTHTNPDYLPSEAEVQNMIDWASARQKAVDDGRRETPHRNVEVYYYIEVNRVRDAMQGKARVTNKVLPKSNPDYVSYSSYDAQRGDIEKSYLESLDYIQSQLPPKPSISGKRVFIGEYGLPMLGNTAQAQDMLTRRVMRAGLKWGCPFVLYWELYNNEVTSDGKQRGFWMIDDRGVKQPVYFTHQKFYEAARRYVGEFNLKNGRVPSREEFGEEALAWLPIETPPEPDGPLVQGAPFVDSLRDFSKVFRHSENLAFDSSKPDIFDGRAPRLRRREADSALHIIYHGAAISRFQITAYTYGAAAKAGEPKLRVYASQDAAQWKELAVSRKDEAIKNGWFRVTLTPSGPMDSPAAYLKIEMLNDPTIYSPQLGEVQLFTGGAAALPKL